MENSNPYDENSSSEMEQTMGKYIDRFYEPSDIEPIRIRHNIWVMGEDLYDFNIIITSFLCIFDAVLFNVLPENKAHFFEELLLLNAHQTKSSKLCLVKNSIHLRIIRGLEDFDYSEFEDHVIEYRELFPVIQDNLKQKYYPE